MPTHHLIPVAVSLGSEGLDLGELLAGLRRLAPDLRGGARIHQTDSGIGLSTPNSGLVSTSLMSRLEAEFSGEAVAVEDTHGGHDGDFDFVNTLVGHHVPAPGIEAATRPISATNLPHVPSRTVKLTVSPVARTCGDGPHASSLVVALAPVETGYAAAATARAVLAPHVGALDRALSEGDLPTYRKRTSFFVRNGWFGGVAAICHGAERTPLFGRIIEDLDATHLKVSGEQLNPFTAQARRAYRAGGMAPLYRLHRLRWPESPLTEPAHVLIQGRAGGPCSHQRPDSRANQEVPR